MKRRNFFRSIALGGMSAALTPIVKAAPTLHTAKEKPATNIKDALAIPRNANSMPGKYPGKVVKATHPGCIVGTEWQDENGSYINAEGKFYGEDRIEKEHVARHLCFGLYLSAIARQGGVEYYRRYDRLLRRRTVGQSAIHLPL